MVVNDTKQSRGLDLLGLRMLGEDVASRLLNGVTTVTPNMRYLAFRSWIVHRYMTSTPKPDSTEFDNFAKRVEAAVVMSQLIQDRSISGLIGSTKGTARVHSEDADLSLEELTKISATTIYGGPSFDLGLTGAVEGIPTLTKERGSPLAEAFDQSLSAESPVRSLAAQEITENISREKLLAIGDEIDMTSLSESERDHLREFVLPEHPRDGEVGRIGTYCLLLHLARSLGRRPTDSDVLSTAIADDVSGIPKPLLSTIDGWARFTVRDVLVAVHETAMQLVHNTLERANPEHTAPSSEIIGGLVYDIEDDALQPYGLDRIDLDGSIARFVDGVDAKLVGRRTDGELARWGGPTEMDLLSGPDIKTPTPRFLAALPYAWILVTRRLGPSLGSGQSRHDIQGRLARARLGVGEVIAKEVDRWHNSSESLREVIAWLTRRSVDQHLRIAWSRMWREPKKSVALLRADGELWTAVGAFEAGRASSRLDQAINWLGQLKLIDENGITTDGQIVLESRLKLLEREAGR